MKILYVIDASGYIYRSYHAIPHMTNAQGQSTNALFGFIRSLQKLRKDFNPEYLVAVFDGPRSIEKRKSQYELYKSARKETPHDLKDQIQLAQEACHILGIPFLSMPGVEADDTMGTIAKWGMAQEKIKTMLCTSDKDLFQFVIDDKVCILNTFKDNLILNEKGVEDQFGIPPSKIVDFLAMTGDSSDSIPGIPGIGPKTASALLQQFGSLDHILSHPELLGKKQELFKTYESQVRLSRSLVTIDTDVEIPQDISFYHIVPIDLEAVKVFYSSMNFHSLLRELLEQYSASTSVKTPSPEEVKRAYHLIDTKEQLDALIQMLSKHNEIAIGTLATGCNGATDDLLGITFSAVEGEIYYLPLNGKMGFQTVLQAIKPFLENPHTAFYGHDIKETYKLLLKTGITLANISFDTMLASYILNAHHRHHELHHLVLEYFGRALSSFDSILGKGKKAAKIEEMLPEFVYQVACEHLDEITRLKALLYNSLQQRSLLPLLNELELPLLKVLAKMEAHGIYVDAAYLAEMSIELQKLIKQIETLIFDLAGETFNLNSPKQLSEILFNKLGIKPPKKTATGLSTSAEVLESLQEYPIAKLILEYRTLEKLRSTYVDALPLEISKKTGRIHCTFNQSVAATGRLSCQTPNLQNIPIRTEIGRSIRTAFRPVQESQYYLTADYSQIELRILAHLSEDPQLVHAFLNGEDIHIHTASLIFNVPIGQVTKEQRHAAKAVNFGVIYGQQAYGLSQTLGIDIGEASVFIDAYFKQYKRVKEFLESCKDKARHTGKAVTYTGRERAIPEINSKNGQIRAAAERLAINTPLQGTAADLIKMAMLKTDELLTQRKIDSTLILQIHDELIFEIKKEDAEMMQTLVKATMEGVMTLRVPLIVDVAVGKNWAEC